MKQNRTSILALAGFVAILGLVGIDLLRSSNTGTPEPTPRTPETAEAAPETPAEPAVNRPSPLGEEFEPDPRHPRPTGRAAM